MMIKTKDLTKVYHKKTCVNHLNMNVEKGMIYGFLGPNGAGKSTSLKMILGLAKPTEGQVFLFGEEITHQNRLEKLKDIGALIESPSYYGHLSGRENLEIIQMLKECDPQEVDRVLEIVRLEKEQDKKVSQYSLGMKQRLGLAGALIGNPKLLILDEPTNGLDPAGIQEMRELIKFLAREFKMTILVSSHLLSEIDQLATHLGIIQNGEMIYQDSLRNLHRYSQQRLALKTIDLPKTIQILEKNNIPFEQERDAVLMQRLTDEAIGQLSCMLGKMNIGITRIEERQKSLEEIFLELTGKVVSL